MTISISELNGRVHARPIKEQPPMSIALATLMSSIRKGAVIVSFGIWSVLGFAYWIPMLCFAIARFSVLVVHVTLTRSDPTRLGNNLERAAGFYVLGFTNIINAINNPRSEKSGDEPSINWEVVALSTLWAALFWAAVAIPFVLVWIAV